MDQPNPLGVGHQPIDECGSRYRKEVSKSHSTAVRAEGPEGYIDVEFSRFDGLPEKGGELQDVREEGREDVVMTNAVTSCIFMTQ